jgi:hypothetical protein
MKDLTRDQLATAAKNYDNAINEGGEGYNPYRAELERRALESAPRPSRKETIHRELEIKDCSIARESGTYDQAEIDALRAELRSIEAAENETFCAEWTREVFEARRNDWNSRVQAHGDKLTMDQVAAITADLGYGIDELRRAKAVYGK